MATPPTCYIIRHSVFILCSLQDMNAAVKQSEESNCNPKWHRTFQIPNRETFSQCVQKSFDTGIVSACARKEIVQMLRSLVLQHTKYPTSEQYNTICEKLVTKFSKLRDTLGSGHVSYTFVKIPCMKIYVVREYCSSIYRDRGRNHSEMLSRTFAETTLGTLHQDPSR